MATLTIPINFEMAATAEMRAIALRLKPHAVCIVPEKREERTTEGGLEVVGDQSRLSDFILPLSEAGCRVSLFVQADERQLEACAGVGAVVVELHTGAYCDFHSKGDIRATEEELKRIMRCAAFADELGLEVHAGHGLTFGNVGPIAALPEVAELNIGHFLIGEAVFMGLEPAIVEIRRLMQQAHA